MESPSRLVFLLMSLLTSLLQFSDSATLVVDGVSEWRNPSVHIGTLSFSSTRIIITNSTFSRTEEPSISATSLKLLFSRNPIPIPSHGTRQGLDSSTSLSTMTPPNHANKAKKLTIKVSSLPPEPENSATAPEMSPVDAPAPVSGGVVSSSPAFSWPFQPRESELAPSPAPSAVFPATSPSLMPEKGDGIPFINSNPAVPLPTGEVDSATIKPLPTSGHGGQVVGLFAVQMALCFVVLLLLL